MTTVRGPAPGRPRPPGPLPKGSSKLGICMAASSGGSRGSGGIVRARKTKPPGRSWHRHRPSVGPGPLPVRGAIRQPGQRPSPPRPFSGGRRTGRGEGRCVGVETYRGLTGGIPVDDGEAVVRLSLPLVLPPPRERRGPARSAGIGAKMPSTGEAIRHPEQRPPLPRPFSRGRRTGRGDGIAKFTRRHFLPTPLHRMTSLRSVLVLVCCRRRL